MPRRWRDESGLGKERPGLSTAINLVLKTS